MSAQKDAPGAFPSIRVKIAWLLLVTLLLLGGITMIALAFLDYENARRLADAFSPDGSMEAFTQAWFQRLHLLAVVGGVLASSLAAAAFLFARRAQAWLGGLPRSIKTWFTHLPPDFKEAAGQMRRIGNDRTAVLSLAGVFLLAVLAHAWPVQAPVTHDEAYTFIFFASKPLSIGLRDYHFPNNHIFHTFLVHLSCGLFGIRQVSLRLPAFLAGALLAPLGYLLGRRWQGHGAGLLAGAAIAAAPLVTVYSSVARGYTLVAFFSLAGFILGSEILRKNNRFLWVLLPVITALGFYSIPVFLYAWGMLYTWLGVAWLSGKFGAGYTRGSFLTALLVSAAAGLGLTGLLYLPVLRYSGFGAFFDNVWVAGLNWQEFPPTLLSRLGDFSREWGIRSSPLLAGLALAGFLAGILLPARSVRQAAPPAQFSLLFIPAVLLLLRPNPWPRTWFFLFPLVILWSAAGFARLLEAVGSRFQSPLRLPEIGVGVMVAGLVFSAGWRTLSAYPHLNVPEGPEEGAVRVLKGLLEERQIVVVDEPNDTPVWFYMLQYGLPLEVIQRNQPFDLAYVLVDTGGGQTFSEVMANRGPDPGFIQWDTARVIARFERLLLYRVEANHEAVEDAYGMRSEAAAFHTPHHNLREASRKPVKILF